MPSSRCVARGLSALLLATALAPELRAQPAGDVAAALVAPAPAGVVAAPRVAVEIAPSVPAALSRSLARADSLASRKHAFHVGAVAGAVTASAFALMLMEPWVDQTDGENRPPGVRAVAAAMLVAAVPGALLGGVTGVIVHDVKDAASRR